MKYHLHLGLLLVSFFFLVPFAKAQTVDTISVSTRENSKFNFFTHVTPSGSFRVKINGELQEPGYRFRLKKGKYNIQIWSPHFKPLDLPVEIKEENKELRLRITLERTEEWLALRKEMKVRSKYKKSKYLLMAGSVISLGVATYSFNKIPKSNFQIHLQETRKEIGLKTFDSQELSSAESRKRTFQTLAYTSLSTAALCGVLAYLNHRKMKKIAEKKLPEDKSFLISSYIIPVNQSNEMGLVGGIKINF